MKVGPSADFSLILAEPAKQQAKTDAPAMQLDWLV
jgi:hypothetical protein